MTLVICYITIENGPIFIKIGPYLPIEHGDFTYSYVSLPEGSWLVVWNMHFIFTYIGKNHPN